MAAPQIAAPAVTRRQTSQTTTCSASQREFQDQPYLQHLLTLQSTFPPLKSFLGKLANVDTGRKLVQEHYSAEGGRVPGRCYGLQFEDDSVKPLQGLAGAFESPNALRNYLAQNPAKASRADNQRRLFILEDTDPDYVDALGFHLGVDPLVFAEQMNTWNFTDSGSVPHRALPSMSHPGKSFTLRYYEIRTLAIPESVGRLRVQMTFAINRRKYEKWRDVDVPSHSGGPMRDKRHGFIRRCISFWTSQTSPSQEGWDAVIMVDPPMSAAKDKYGVDYMLRDPANYESRSALWNAHSWKNPDAVQKVPHHSSAYHNGCSTLASITFSELPLNANCQTRKFQIERDLASPLDEQVFYWTQVASAELIRSVKVNSSNTMYYLLKHVAQHWVSQLELINCTVAKGEYLSDDYQANLEQNTTGSQWRAELVEINLINTDINYLRRQMNHFWRVMVLNIERLGIQLGAESIDHNAPLALRDAQRDFLTIRSRLQPLRERVEGLSAMANELASLRAAFKGIQDSDFGLRLSLFAAVIFPLTLVASIMSMGGDYLPGNGEFWIFWVSSLPPALLFVCFLLYGGRPDKIFKDLKNLIIPASRQSTGSPKLLGESRRLNSLPVMQENV